MTNEEAIRGLQHIRSAIRNGIPPTKPGKAIEAIDLAISALSRDRWISVEEALPEGHFLWKCEAELSGLEDDTDEFESEKILFCSACGKVMCGRYDYSISRETGKTLEEGWYSEDEDSVVPNVVAWMLLPEPPKEET